MKRERKGSGSFTDLGRRGWRYRFTLAAGVRRSVTARTQEQCRELAAEERRRWRLRVVGSPTEALSTYLERWLTAQEDRLRPRTVQSYRSSARTIILPALKDVRLADLTHRDIEGMMRRAMQRGLSARSANLARAVLSAAMKDAMRDALLTVNPAALARAIPQRRPLITAPNPAQIDTLLAATRTGRRWPLYVLAVSLGLRQGELLALRWEDVTGDRVRVVHTLRRAKGGSYLDPPKTPSSVRTLPQTPQVAAALEVQRAYVASDRLLRKDKGWVEWPDDLVFRTREGRPVSGNELTKAFQRDLEAAELPRFRFHDLRHACATWLLSLGVELKVISEILGHSSIAVTASTYAHVNEATMRDALGRMHRE